MNIEINITVEAGYGERVALFGQNNYDRRGSLTKYRRNTISVSG